jgi:hypothetical protein
MWVMRRWIMDDAVVEEGILAFGVVGSELGANPHSVELGRVSSYAMFLAMIMYAVVEASMASALWYVSTAYMLPASDPSHRSSRNEGTRTMDRGTIFWMHFYIVGMKMFPGSHPRNCVLELWNARLFHSQVTKP